MKKKFTFFTFTFFVLYFLFLLPCHGNLVCEGPSIVYLGNIIIWVLILIPLSLFALVLNDEKHKSWLKFSTVFFVISMIIVFITPEYGSGIVSIDRELVNWFFAGLYTLVSILYFITQFIKQRKNKRIK